MHASTNSATGAGTADFDAGTLTAWLEEHVAGFRGPIALMKFEGGQSNPTYRLDSAAGSYVLRRKPFGTLLPSAHAVEREYRVLMALHPLGFPVPRVFALCEDQAVIGSAFYLLALPPYRLLALPRQPTRTPQSSTLFQAISTRS